MAGDQAEAEEERRASRRVRRGRCGFEGGEGEKVFRPAGRA